MGKIKYVFLTIVIILLIFGSFGLINSLNKTKDTVKKEITASSFYVGGINQLGQNVKSETSFITDKMGVQGLTIKPKSNSEVTFIVYYYDNLMEFVGKTEELNSIYSYNEERDDIKYCRIQVYAPIGEKATIWNKSKYISQLNISIDKKQVTETKEEKIGLYVKNIIVHYTDGSTTTFNENGFEEKSSDEGVDYFYYHINIDKVRNVDYIEFIFNRDVIYVNENFEGNKNNSYVEFNRLVCDYVNDPEVTVSGVRFVLHKDCVKDYYGNFITKKVVLKVRR